MNRWNAATTIAAGALLAASAVADDAAVTFLYRLADFGGVVELNQPRMAPDPETDELLATQGNTVRIFAPSGMAVYEFDHDAEAHGQLADLAPLAGGDILLLGRFRGRDSRVVLTRCDYRGNPRSSFEVQGLPPGLEGFFPGVLRVRQARLYLAELSSRRVVQCDLAGRFVRAWDLTDSIGGPEADPVGLELTGFDVDDSGKFYATVPTLGLGFRISPDGRAESFGEGGSGRGTIGVARGIAVTDRGWVLVADILNQVVLVFDERLAFRTDLPEARRGPQRLVSPSTVVAAGDRVFVGEVGKRGVAVYRVGPR